MMNSSKLSLILILLLFFACSPSETDESETNETETLGWESVQDTTMRVHSISGFDGPEAVRYDPAQDVYFVSNFNGDGNDRDANGYISKLLPEGTIEAQQFMTGTDAHPLHAPRGMYITGDTLWAADVDGVHGFNRTTGEQVQFIDFTGLEPGFLNDIAATPDGTLYVTDTGANTLYRIDNTTPTVVHDDLPHAPNGITLDPESGNLILAPWGGALTFHMWDADSEELTEFATAQSGGNMDGIEFYNGRLLAASQVDSSLHMISGEEDLVHITMPGRPADIGVDTERNQVAVPYIALNRVDIWQLPED